MTTETFEKWLHTKSEKELVEAMAHTAHTANELDNLGDHEDAMSLRHVINEELTAIFDKRVASLHPHSS